MMKFLRLILLSITTLIPGLALAHGGHNIDAGVHSFLHTEHIVMLVLIGLVITVMATFKDR